MLPLSFPPRCRKSLQVILRAYSSGPPAPKRPWRGKRESGPDPKQLRMSRELSYLLRHGAHTEALPIRPDGYVNVDVLLRHRTLRGIDFAMLENIVKADQKSRYHLLYDPRDGPANAWWIRANQGHSMADISLDLRRIKHANEIRMAVHGTSMAAWESIAKQGLSRMSRNHIHLAQGVVGDVISGMRHSSEILIFIDVARALAADIKFYISSNGVVLTPGDELGFLHRHFFSRVERVRLSATPIPGWEARVEETTRDEGKDTPDHAPQAEDEPPPTDEQPEVRLSAAQRRKIRGEEYAAQMRRSYTGSELEFV
ncbi:KptA family-domain-containing protein [Mycena crocata]|nr:KptA family-domain-containing protein [Mycena crocata]